MKSCSHIEVTKTGSRKLLLKEFVLCEECKTPKELKSLEDYYKRELKKK